VEEKARIKALTTAKCISDAKKCKTVTDWVEYITRLHAIELAEMKEGQDKWFLHRWVTDIPLLGHTLTAVRAYVLDQIKDETFETSIKHQLDHADTFKSNLGYHHQYFQDITRIRDHRGLNEKSFNDFANNVICDKRKAEIAELLLSKHNKPEQDAQRAAEAAAERTKQAKIEEDTRKARLEAERAEEARRIAVAEKAKREDDERRAALEKARRQDEERRTAEKARHEEEERRRAEELQRIHDEEKSKLRALRVQESAPIAAQSENGRTPRTRRKSVNFDPQFFSQNTRYNDSDPMEIDSSNMRNRRTSSSRRGNG
jgi:hypothetical protein